MDNNENKSYDNGAEQENSGCCGKLKDCQDTLKESQERLAYLAAEFDNYKKRTERERSQWIMTTQAAVLSDVLNIVDDFERALHQIRSQDLTKEAKAHLEGFELITKAVYKLLEKYDIEEIMEVNIFDPESHEAIMQVQSVHHESGQIVDIVQKGYRHKGQVLRPSKVTVAE